jgi:hypothetical protein
MQIEGSIDPLKLSLLCLSAYSVYSFAFFARLKSNNTPINCIVYRLPSKALLLHNFLNRFFMNEPLRKQEPLSFC